MFYEICQSELRPSRISVVETHSKRNICVAIRKDQLCDQVKMDLRENFKASGLHQCIQFKKIGNTMMVPFSIYNLFWFISAGRAWRLLVRKKTPSQLQHSTRCNTLGSPVQAFLWTGGLLLLLDLILIRNICLALTPRLDEKSWIASSLLGTTNLLSWLGITNLWLWTQCKPVLVF